MHSSDILQGHSKEWRNDFVHDLWCIHPAVRRASQVLAAFGCSNMFSSKAGQQEERSRTITLERRLNVVNATASKTWNATLFQLEWLEVVPSHLWTSLSSPVGVLQERSCFPSLLWYPVICEGQGVRANIYDRRFKHHTPNEAACVCKANVETLHWVLCAFRCWRHQMTDLSVMLSFPQPHCPQLGSGPTPASQSPACLPLVGIE